MIESLRDEDFFSKSKNAYAVTHIFSRSNDKKKYTDLLYLDKNMALNNLSKEIKAMLDESLLDTKF